MAGHETNSSNMVNEVKQITGYYGNWQKEEHATSIAAAVGDEGRFVVTLRHFEFRITLQ